MKRERLLPTLIYLFVSFLGSSIASAKESEPEVVLSATGKKYEQTYTEQLQLLKAELIDTLPVIDEQKKTDFLKARELEVTAREELDLAQKRMGEISTARALVAHAKGKWIGGANKGIKEANEKIKKAVTSTQREAAEQELAHWQQNKKDGEKALRERQAKLDQVLAKQVDHENFFKIVKKTHEKAKANTLQAVKELDNDRLLSNSILHAQLAKFVLMTEATPKGLAAFAQQGDEQKRLIDKLLVSDDLIIQMMVADGAKGGKYGRAIKIYTDIWKASNKVAEGPLPRLALAIALEHAEPIKQRNAEVDINAPVIVDPVKRYLHFEKAFLAGELDPAFKDLSTWEYRMVVNGEEPDHILAWGREMLRNYRPDHISTQDYRWRYVALVRSDIRYGSQDNKYDKPELQFFQNILMNGGICGRRAFIGRFILRAFGIPTTARPQKGHAALAHWTPDGWVICLGGGWGAGYTKTKYKDDLDFLATTQARAAGKPFMKVKHAQWLGELAGEPRVYGFGSKQQPDFWHAVSLYTQKEIIKTSQAKTLAAVGEDIGEANVTKEKVEIIKVTITEKNREISINEQGTITIPAVATSRPTKSNGKIIFMNSHLSGKQLHFGRNGGKQTFEYNIDVPVAGVYHLTSKVVTPSWKQHLVAAINGKEEAASIELPHTVGMWENTEPVVVNLKEGSNTLSFSHKSDGYAKGFSIKEFTLTPVKGE